MILTLPVNRIAFPLFNIHLIEASPDTDRLYVDFNAVRVPLIRGHSGCVQRPPASVHTAGPRLHRHCTVQPSALHTVITALLLLPAAADLGACCTRVQLAIFTKHELNFK